MLKKKIPRVAIINTIVFLIGYIVYFIYMSFTLYTVQYIPGFYPLGILYTAFLIMVTNIFLKQRKESIISVIIVCLFAFIGLTIGINALFEKPLKGYFSIYRYKSLMHYGEYYKKQKDEWNVKRYAESKGIVVTSIIEGWNNYTNNTRNIYYLVNETYYILFNKNTSEVTDFVDGNKLINEHIEVIQRKEDFKKIVDQSIMFDAATISYASTELGKEYTIIQIPTDKKFEFTKEYKIIPIPTDKKFEFRIEESK